MTPPPGWFPIDRDAADRAAEVGASAWLVYAILCRHADESRHCYPGIATIASKTGLSQRSVRYAIKRLEAAGWIVVNRGRGKVNSYDLLPLEVGQPVAVPPKDCGNGLPRSKATSCRTVRQPVAAEVEQRNRP